MKRHDPVARIALISNPHGEFESLTRALAAAAHHVPDEIWCLGDLVGDAAPNETVAHALETCTIVLAGNHDLVAAGLLDEAHVWTHGGERMLDLRSKLSKATLMALSALATVHASGGVVATHACLDHPTAHIEDAYGAEMQLVLCGGDFLVVGHSHRPFAFAESVGWIASPLAPGQVHFVDQAVICPGSVVDLPNAPAPLCQARVRQLLLLVY